MKFLKNNNLKIATLFSCFLLVSCYEDHNLEQYVVNFRIEQENEIKEETRLETEEEIIPIISFSSYIQYDSIDSIANRATDIIRGEVLSYRVEKVDVAIPIHLLPDYMFGLSPGLIPPKYQYIIDEPNPVYDIFTIYSIKVHDVFKGSINKYEIIDFARRGGEYEGIRLFTHEENPLTIGEEFILFMEAPIREGRPFFRINPSQAVYRFAEPNPSNLAHSIDVEFENISERGSLTLTLTDLMNIAEANFPTDNPEDDEATPKITREKLALAIQEAEERIQTTYTQISWARLLNLLRDARNVYNNLEATQLEIDDVTNNLRLAIETLEELPPEPEPVDRTELIAAIEAAEERMQTMYTPISWARLQNPLRDARNVYSNLNATQIEIDDVTDNLRLAIETLEELPPEPEPIDRTELIAAIQEAEARVQATYTPISWARLQNPLRDARNIRDNANATQEQIVSTTEILIGALNGLVSR